MNDYQGWTVLDLIPLELIRYTFAGNLAAPVMLNDWANEAELHEPAHVHRMSGWRVQAP